MRSRVPHIRKLILESLAYSGNISKHEIRMNPNANISGCDGYLTPTIFKEIIEKIGQKLDIWKTDLSPEYLSEKEIWELNSFNALSDYFEEAFLSETAIDESRTNHADYGLIN